MADDKFTSAKQVRSQLLEWAPALVEAGVHKALGLQSDYKGDPDLLKFMLKSLLPAMKISDDSLDLGDAEASDKTEMVNQILAQMNAGQLTIEQANDAISAINNGFDVVELDNLVRKFQESKA